MRAIGPEFNTNRMVREYAERTYLPAIDHYATITTDKLKSAKGLASWNSFVRSNWMHVRVMEAATPAAERLKVGDSLTVNASVELGELSPSDVSLELCYGTLNAR